MWGCCPAGPAKIDIQPVSGMDIIGSVPNEINGAIANKPVCKRGVVRDPDTTMLRIKSIAQERRYGAEVRTQHIHHRYPAVPSHSPRSSTL